jgi:hypothetical protein
MGKFDDEFGDLSGYKILSFEEVSKGFEGNKSSLQGIAGTSFKEVSNAYAAKSPFGKESIFYKAKEGSFRSYLEEIGFTAVTVTINIKYQ